MAMPKLYALLVGINNYAHSITAGLIGTHIDVESIQRQLQIKYSNDFELDIHILLDAQATRDKVVEELEQHLGQAQEEDVAFFFFAGHGSWIKTNEEFQDLNFNKVENTLVCHDSRMPKKYDLSERELLVLYNYITRHQATLIVVLDACHTVKFERHPHHPTRLLVGTEKAKKIEHYLYDATVEQNKFYYYKELLTNKEVKVLSSVAYVCYAACSDAQYAYENEEGGWFTRAFLKAMRNIDALSYFQFYHVLLSEIVTYPVQQTPTLVAYRQFDVYKAFITNKTATNTLQRFKVFEDQNKVDYRVQFGAELGFPINLGHSIYFNLFDREYNSTIVGKGVVKFLGIQDSPIHISLLSPSDKYKEHYWAELLNFTNTPLLVGFMGTEQDWALLNDAVQECDIPQILFVKNSNHCPFYIAQQSNIYRLYQKDRPTFLLEFEPDSLNDSNFVALLIKRLEHLRQWYDTINLANPKSTILYKDVLFKFTLSNTNPTADPEVDYYHNGKKIRTDLKSANEFPQKEYNTVYLNLKEDEEINYNIALFNTASYEDYYASLLLVTPNYGVLTLDSNIPLLARATINDIIDPYYNSLFFEPTADQQLHHYLKVILSKEKLPSIEGFMLDELTLEQDFIPMTRTTKAASKRIQALDWQCLTLHFELNKKT